jgi:hypothetical protein
MAEMCGGEAIKNLPSTDGCGKPGKSNEGERNEVTLPLKHISGAMGTIARK